MGFARYGGAMNILIVEADLNTQALLQSRLESLDHFVLAARGRKRRAANAQRNGV